MNHHIRNPAASWSFNKISSANSVISSKGFLFFYEKKRNLAEKNLNGRKNTIPCFSKKVWAE